MVLAIVDLGKVRHSRVPQRIQKNLGLTDTHTFSRLRWPCRRVVASFALDLQLE